MVKKKKTFILISLLVFTALSCTVIIYNRRETAPELLMDYYFGDSEKRYIEDLAYEDNQKVKVGDYVFTLEEVITESSIPKVYCKFTVINNGMDMREMKFKDGGDSFGELSESSRFRLFLDYEKNMGGSKFKFKASKDVLYVYCEFALQPTDNDINIYLYDRNSGRDEERLSKNASGEFHIKKNQKAKTYHCKDEEIVVTPFRFVVRSETGLYCSKLEIFYKDKKSLLVRDGDNYENVSSNIFGTAPENPYGSGYSNERFCDLEFEEPIDVQNIEYICVNGDRLE